MNMLPRHNGTTAPECHGADKAVPNERVSICCQGARDDFRQTFNEIEWQGQQAIADPSGLALRHDLGVDVLRAGRQSVEANGDGRTFLVDELM